MKDAETGAVEEVTYNLAADDLPLFRSPRPEDEDRRNHRLMKNKGHFQTAIRKLTDSTFFFPTSGLYKLTCYTESNGNTTDSLECNILQTSDQLLEPTLLMNRGIFDVKVKSAPSSNPANMKTLYVTEINPSEPEDFQTSTFLGSQCSFDVSFKLVKQLIVL